MAVGTDGSLGDPLDSVTLEDAAVTPETAAPESGQPTDSPETPPPSQTTETLEPASPSLEGGPETPAVPLTPQFVAPTGEPFTLRVDRHQIPLDGAVQTPDGGVYFSPDSWRKVQAQYVGDRGGWQQEKRALIAQAQAGSEGLKQKEAQVTARLDELAAIFNDSTGQLLQEQFQNWQTNGPLLLKNAELRMAQARLDELQAKDAERAEEQRVAEAVPRMQGELGSELEKLLAEDFKGLFTGDQPVALIRDLWANHLGQVFYEDAQGPHLDPFALRQLVEIRAVYARRAQAGQAQVEKVKATNAAALAPTKPGVAVPAKAVPPKVKARDENGKFTKPDADEWERDFMKKTYLTA